MKNMTYLSNAEVERVVLPNTRDLGGFEVRRALPSAMRRMVGPFIFLDSFGPVTLEPGQGIDSRPHPHIGLATLTYLVDGELIHRDSESYVQPIGAGEVNVMVAGRGIVHSERTSDTERARTSKLFGFQSWVALPSEHEETEPGFQHIAADDIPAVEGEGIRFKLLAGSLHGRRSPAKQFSELFYGELVLGKGARYRIDGEHIERALFLSSGTISIGGQEGRFSDSRLIVFKPGAEIVITAVSPSRVIVLGGEPLPEKRHIQWNFVSTSEDRIHEAARHWRERRFPGVPGDSEFTPLPGDFNI
ncbi:pirin domain-containing protein [Sinorhizobium meliloti CCNWSX0020]|uniref:Pirin domain-containing protein n=2 Tax=Rhizobium meliloti TaxID=382 RepID=H0G2C5_RHIML|nr:pirin domain-containing protein [Sinorhizobium meliloti CCNWSX0020]